MSRGIVRWSAHLGGSVGASETVTVIVGGSDITEYVIETNRIERLCMTGATWLVALDLNCPTTVYPWDSIVLYEDGAKVLTGYIASVSTEFSKKPRITIEGVDTWKRALDYWTTEEYYTSGDTMLGLVAYYLDMCGLSYSLESGISYSIPDGLIIPISPVSEILIKLASAAGLFYLIDEDGVVHVNDVVGTMDSGTDITQGTNLIDVALEQGDYRSRNKVIVWGPTTHAVVRSDEDWAVVDHTMVFANPYIYNALDVANYLHSQYRELEEVVTCETLHDPSRRVGQRVDITSDVFTDTEIATTVQNQWNQSVGARTITTFGERCWGGAGPGPAIDGRDIIVATKECGVWRCLDIWADTPHWYPLNDGLEESFVYNGDTLGSTFDCNWFIRDPYRPNDLAFLLTDHGVFYTNSLEPNSCEWNPRLMNVDLSPYWLSDFTSSGFYIARIRSTVAREGSYYAVVCRPDTASSEWGQSWVALTNDHFTTLNFGRFGYSSLSPGYPNVHPVMASELVGDNCYYGYQMDTALGTWHRGHNYLGADNQGGLAAWHRNDYGCTVSAVTYAPTVGATGEYWECMRGTVSPYYSSTTIQLCDRDSMILPPLCNFQRSYSPFGCWWTGNPLTPNTLGYWPQSSGNALVPKTLGWYMCPSLHIPYDQSYNADGSPSVYYFSPGYAEGTAGAAGITALRPTRNNVPLILPWASTPSLCNRMQGSIGTYTQDEREVACWSGGNPSYFAYSSDRGDSWTSSGQVPFATGCFSGFPRSEQKVYAGRDPARDPSTNDDRSLIYVSWDRGATWTDVTGDLWTQTQALELRENPDSNDPVYVGASGLVTIAPRYC